MKRNNKSSGSSVIDETIPLRWLPLLVRLRGKSPAINGEGWLERALERTEMDPLIRSHLLRWSSNVGLVVPRGHIVIDPDHAVALARAEQELDPLGGPRAETGSGKAHYLFRLPKRLHGKVASGDFIFDEITFDSKADGAGQIVIAPSIHPDTRQPYSWIRPPRGTRIPMLPDPWCDALKPKRPPVNGRKITTTPWNGALPKRVESIAKEDPRVKALIERPVSQIRALRGKSESHGDMALAHRLGRWGVAPAQIEHALRYRRSRVLGRPKSDGYFRHTVEKALGILEPEDES